MPDPNAGSFPATQWSLVSRIHSEDETEAKRALNELCAQYHYPLYCYIRRRGLAHHDAQDALHEFLAKLLRNDAFQQLNADHGRLRGFLGTSLRRFLFSWHSSQAHERAHISLECEQELTEAERRFQRERLTDADTPERIFERKWAGELLRRVQQRLRAQYVADGKKSLYEALRPCLLNGGGLRGEDTSAIAAALGISTGALRVSMTRLMADYRVVLRREVAQTVENIAEVDDEIACLLRAFQRKS